MAPRFQPLRISAVAPDAADAIAVSLEAPAAWRDFTPGQYVTLRATIGGRDVRRCYSICSAPREETIRVGIKRVPGGLFSEWACSTLRPGGTILTARPEGRFGVAPEPARSRVFAAFAAGSGITPVLSIMTAILTHEPASRFFLFFGNRATGAIMFRGEIEDLKDRFLSRLSVFHVLSREKQELDVLNGHLDAARVPLLTRLFPAPDRVFVCGPLPMIADLEPALAAAGIPADRIQVERFTPALDGSPAPMLVPAGAPARSVATVILEGARRVVPVAEGETIIDAAIRAGIDPPFSCRAGMCCTCRARLLEGDVTMRTNYSLEPWEVDARFVLTCQSVPRTAAVTVDYDHV